MPPARLQITICRKILSTKSPTEGAKMSGVVSVVLNPVQLLYDYRFCCISCFVLR